MLIVRRMPCTAPTTLFAPETEPAGVRRHPVFRIPAVVATGGGDLLAFCEARESDHDHGNIDLVMLRSRDGGRTWGEWQVVVASGADTTGNPCPIADGDHVHLLYARAAAAARSERQELWHIESRNGGRTWSAPRDITGQIRTADTRFVAVGPVHGIVLRSGRLVAPAYILEHSGTRHLFTVFSDDRGRTWQRGALATARGVNEVVAVELNDGRLVLNARDQSGGGVRLQAESNDAGVRFGAVQPVPELLDCACQASLVRLRDGHLAFSAPHRDRSPRTDLRVQVSADDGRSWPRSFLVQPGPLGGGYSDLVQAADGALIVVYEMPGGRIVATRVSLEDPAPALVLDRPLVLESKWREPSTPHDLSVAPPLAHWHLELSLVAEECTCNGAILALTLADQRIEIRVHGLAVRLGATTSFLPFTHERAWEKDGALALRVIADGARLSFWAGATRTALRWLGNLETAAAPGPVERITLSAESGPGSRAVTRIVSLTLC